MNHKLNLVFEQLSLQKFTISSIIRKCIQETLRAEGVGARCEINVLVTDDKGKAQIPVIADLGKIIQKTDKAEAQRQQQHVEYRVIRHGGQISQQAHNCGKDKHQTAHNITDTRSCNNICFIFFS